MLKFGEKEKQILDALLRAEPKAVAKSLGIKISQVYYTKTQFRRKAQNAEEFLAVAKGKYGSLLKRRLKTPKIMPRNEDEEWEY